MRAFVSFGCEEETERSERARERRQREAFFMLDSGGESRLEARREEKSEPKCF